MGDFVRNITSNSAESFKGFFTRKFWTDPKETAQVIFDPGHLAISNKAESPRPPTDAQAIADAAAAREQERRRIASSGSQTTFSGRRSDALSASIGKRYLGGAA